SSDVCSSDLDPRRDDGYCTMGSYPSVGTRPLAAGRMVSRCAAHADGSAARRQRDAYPRATTVNRDPSLTSHALDRRPPARAVATAADLLGTALRCLDRKSTRLNSSHVSISYAVFCLKKNKKKTYTNNA